MYSRRAYHLRRVVATAALLVILFNHADDLLRFLERALSASPRQQAMWIISPHRVRTTRPHHLERCSSRDR